MFEMDTTSANIAANQAMGLASSAQADNIDLMRENNRLVGQINRLARQMEIDTEDWKKIVRTERFTGDTWRAKCRVATQQRNEITQKLKIVVKAAYGDDGVAMISKWLDSWTDSGRFNELTEKHLEDVLAKKDFTMHKEVLPKEQG